MKIVLQNVSYTYRSPIAPPKTVLSAIDLTIGSGELMAVVGATGSGKTTLIQLFNGLLTPERGRVQVGDWDSGSPERGGAQLHRRVGLVFQFPENQIFEETVFDEIAFGPRNLKIRGEALNVRVKEAMSMVGLDMDRYARRSPFRLSGGERRRIAIAGILAMDPEILVLDEPTAGLDFRGSRAVENLLIRYHQRNRTVIFVSHDMDLVGRLARRIVVLEKGHIVYDGDPVELFMNRSACLESCGLDVPSVIRFLQDKREAGYTMSRPVFTVGEAKEILAGMRRKKTE